MKNTKQEKRKYATREEVLDLIAKGGTIAIVAMVTPFAISAVIPDLALELADKVWQKYDQRRLKRTVKEMIQRELLAYNEADKETALVVTNKGKKTLLKYNIKRMELEKPKTWDGKWRVVIFDVMEGKKSLREALRNKMKQLGFYQLQKSVYVTPYPCDKEISFIREYYLIGSEVSYFLATELEQEGELVKKFELRK